MIISAKPRHRRLNLLWKLLIPVVIIFTVAAAILLLRSWQTLSQQLDVKTQEQLDAHARVLSNLFAQWRNEYAHIGTEIASALQAEPGDGLQSHIEESSDLFVRLSWSLVVDSNQKRLARWVADPNRRDPTVGRSAMVRSVLRASRPQGTVSCVNSCEYIIGVPATINGRRVVVLLATPLSDLLPQFQGLTGVDLILVRNEGPPPKAILAQTLTQISPSNLAVFTGASLEPAGSALVAGRVYAWSVADLRAGASDTEIVRAVVVQDLTEQHAAVRRQMQRHTVQYLAMLILSLVLLSWMLNRRLSRLRRLTDVLPALSKAGGYEDTRRALVNASRPGRYADEVDDLRDTLFWLSERLEQLHEAEAASDAKSRFLATMSHEIRTPMSGILGLTEILAQGGLTPDQKRMAQMVHDSTHNLLHIINDVLDYSKIEAGAAEVDSEPFSPAELVESVADLISVSAARKNLRLKVHWSPGIPSKLRGDVGKIRQIVLNLASNAVKFTDVGSVAIRLDCRPINDAECDFVVAVSDTGIGIKPAAQRRVFQRFRQADASTTRQYGGTGLGLAISDGLARLMNGDLQLESTFGAGTTFTLRLCLPISEEAEPLNTQALERYAVELCVEGDDRACLQAHLEGWGAKVGPCDGRAEMPCISIHDAPSGDVTQVEFRFRHGAEARSVNVTRPLKIASIATIIQGLVDGENRPGSVNVTKGLRQFGVRVLVAEDQPVNRELLGRQLRSLGCKAVLCTNGVEALQLLDEEAGFDLVITDLHMPVMDGYELVRRIRSHAKTGVRDMPVIVLTASASTKDLASLSRHGVNRKLVKPASLAALEQCLSDFAVNEEMIDVPVMDDEIMSSNMLPLIDKDLLHDVFGDDLDIVKTYHGMYLENTLPLLDECRAAVAANDHATVESVAHKLAGSTRSLGGVRLAAMLKDLEHAASAGENDLQRLMQRIDETLKAFLDALNELTAD